MMDSVYLEMLRLYLDKLIDYYYYLLFIYLLFFLLFFYLFFDFQCPSMINIQF